MLVPHGGWLMRGLAKGIKDNMRLVDASLSDVNAQIAGPRRPAPPPPPPPPRMEVRDARYAQPQGKQITQHITVNTQEINPRRHAAELGWELANRM